MENINELIDKNLNLLANQNECEISSHKFIDMNNRELTQRIRGEQFAEEMEIRNLVRRNNTLCKITDFGYSIFKSGGWLKYQEDLKNQIQSKKIEEENKKNLTKEKLKYDLLLSKWQVRSFWYLFVFALLGGIYGGIELYNDLTKDKDDEVVTVKELNKKFKQLKDSINLDENLIEKPQNKIKPAANSGLAQ